MRDVDITRDDIPARFLLAPKLGKRDVIEIPATVVIKRVATGRAANAHSMHNRGGAIAGNMSSVALGAMYHGGKR